MKLSFNRALLKGDSLDLHVDHFFDQIIWHLCLPTMVTVGHS